MKRAREPSERAKRKAWKDSNAADLIEGFVNTNAQAVKETERLRREVAKAEQSKVAARDKSSNVADKARKDQAKEARKAAAVKGERRK